MKKIALVIPFIVSCCLIASAETPQAGGKIRIVPESFVRGYDPVTIFFPNATGPAAAGPEDHPEKYLRSEPAQPGEFRWIDARTLIFKPTIPWPPLERFRWSVGEYHKTLTTMMIPPTTLSPADGANELDPVQEVVLTFREPVTKLDSMVGFEIRPLPGIDKRGPRRLTSDDFLIKPLERASAKDPVSYVFRFKKPIEDGVRVLIHIRLSLDDSSDSLAEYSFSTKQPFRVLSAGCTSGTTQEVQRPWQQQEQPEESTTADEESTNEEGSEETEGEVTEDAQQEEPQAEESATPSYESQNLLPLTISGSRYSREQAVNGGTGTPKIAVLFSSEPEALSLSAVKSLIRFTPSIRDMSFTQAGPFLYITGKVEKDTVYAATIQPSPIKDLHGRVLKMTGISEFHIYFPHQEPFLRWSQSAGIVERFGPQMFPMSGRGESKVDLRIYRVDPLDRNFWPFPASPVSVKESDRPPGPGEEPPSADTLQNYIDADQLAVRLKLLGSPPVSKIVALPLRKEGSSTDFGLALKEHLRAIAGPDAPGTYLVGVRRLGEESERQYVRLQVTDLCLSTVEEERSIEFLVTSLKTGKPIPGAKVLVEGIPANQDGTAYAAIISGITDARGLFRWEHREKAEVDLRRIVVRNGDDALVLQPNDPPYSFSNNHWYGPSGIWLNWINSDPYVDPEASMLMCHILTERPVYRPEEEVHIKGYLRMREKGRLKLPPASNYELLITAPGEGEKVWNFPVTLTSEGSFYYKFQDKDLPTGEYTATLRDIDSQVTYGHVDWKMEAYKIPRFEVNIHGPDRVPMDREFTMSMTADYYAGGRVVGQPVLWRVTQFPYAYVPEKREGFVFSSDERFSRPSRFSGSGAIEKSDKTDDSGASKIAVNPALEIDGKPRQYVFEVTVTGADEQTVSATRSVIGLPSFVLGLQVDRFLKKTTTITPKIIAIDVNNKLLAGQDVAVRLLAREWHSHLRETDFAEGQAKYETDMVDREVFKTTIQTADQPVSVTLPAEKAGIYVVELSSRDQLGRLQLVTTDLYVAGDEPISWKKPEANVFETVTDKTEYVPGETAQILLKSPFQQADILAVIEGPDGNVYQEFPIVGGKAVFVLPIKNEYNPQIPVHFLLMRGRIVGGAATAGPVDLGKPSTVAATQWVKVKPVDNVVNVELKHPDKATPGQEISMQIKLSSPDGKPLPGEVTLWLVDQAVLSLGKEKRLDPLPSFISDVKSHIAIRDTRNKIIGELVTVENPGGGGAEGEAELLDKVTVRKEFKTVPYYNPRIMVDKTGMIEVKIKLSDDLTIFKVRAVAISGPDRFGSAKSQIAVRLPVIVQQALPRFVRIGDRLVAGGIGRIVEGEGGLGSCQVQVDGASLEGDSKHAIQWIKDKPEKLFFPMTVDVPKVDQGRDVNELTVRLAVIRDSDKASDAFEVKLPILRDRDPLSVEVFKELNSGTPLMFPSIQEKVREGSARQSILITDQEALLKMISGLDYLYQYNHLCTEQRVSQSFPAVALKGIYDTYKIRAPEKKLNEVLAYTFDYLGKTLKPNGLYSYWPGGDGRVTLTAYVVEFLSEAKKAGYQFPPKLMEKPVAALKEALRSDYAHFIDGASFMERCEALAALSNAGQFDVSYGSELGKKAGFLDLYSEAKVLQACNLGQKCSKDIFEKLRKDLWDNTLFKLRDGSEVYGGLQSRIKSWGGQALSSEIKTQAAMIRALYPKDAANPKFQLMVSDLIESGEKDGWGNTNTNAAALLALRDIISTPRKDMPAAELSVDFGDSKNPLHIGADQPTAFLLSRDVRQGKVNMTSGGGKLYARMNVTYLPQAMGDQVAAKNEGFVVTREIIRVSTGSEPNTKEWIEKPGTTITCRLGDITEEHIQVINPDDRNYVAVIAPFAAGLEPMNPNLATSPKEAQPSGSLTRDPSYAMYIDDEVRFYYEQLPKGTYDFYFRIRAMTEGSYVHPAAHAEMMYQPATKGNSAGARVVIEKGEETDK